MLHLRQFLVCFAFLVAGVLLGCSRTGPSGKWGSGLTTINSPTAEYSIVRLEHDGRPFLILAVDIVGNGKVSGGTGKHNGSLVAASGTPEIAWSCSTEDGVRGNVTIADQQFDLMKGGLFLVTTRGPAASVRQVAVPLEDLQERNLPRGFSNEGRKQPAIATFLNEASSRLNDNSVDAEHPPEPAVGSAANGEPSPPAR